MTEGVSNLKVPTTVMVGDKDRMIPPRSSVRIANVLNATGSLEQLIMLPGVGHCLNVEAPKEFNSEVQRLAAQFGTTGVAQAHAG